ncbi:MAG: DUF2752 domain-containing protein [Marinilabiliaceae bacterium]|nr:DUF2752 domain-containing protein [Marinilabiliaceae bacterium]
MNKNKSVIQDYRLFQWFAIGALMLVLFYPIVIKEGWLYATCPFVGSVKNPCPSCGLTTGWLELYGGHFSSVAQANRHSLPLILLVVLQLVWRIILLIKLSQIKHPLLIDGLVSGCLIVFLAGPYCLDLIWWLADSPMLPK